jgi:sorbitol-6-phosphate 2-dehydrogenase
MEFPEETWDAIIDVNLKGTFLCARAASRVMVEQRSGSIIMINSKSGKKGGLWLAAYCASKFGGIGLIQSIALDLAPFNVRANAICPGNVFSTPMWDLLDKEYSRKLGIPPEQVRQKYLEKVPLGRECKVEDVASAAVFLASDEASYITGISLSVTGGQEMN